MVYGHPLSCMKAHLERSRYIYILPSLKITARPWKSIVGRWWNFLLEPGLFSGAIWRSVSFREDISGQMVHNISPTGFTWNKGISLTTIWGKRSCELAIIWPGIWSSWSIVYIAYCTSSSTPSACNCSSKALSWRKFLMGLFETSGKDPGEKHDGWYCWWLKSCTSWVEGGSLSHYLRRVHTPQVVSRILAINSLEKSFAW